MKSTIFTGSACALVTPFCNGRVDYPTLGRLIDRQIEAGTQAIVVCGTTGEAPTLTDKEHKKCIRYAVEHTDGRIPVIAGSGSNDIAHAVAMSRYACQVGADALLVVTPYYNKATPNGLIRSFFAVADAVDKPVIVYNVPSRTGCRIPLSVYRELAKHERIVAVKEAGSDIGETAALQTECGDLLDVYSGNDDRILPVLSLGGKGVISVLANIMPDAVQCLCRQYAKGYLQESAELQLSLFPLIRELFCEVNPIPVKTALAAMGLCKKEFRLPLCPMEPENEARLLDALRAHGLLDA